MIEVRLMGGLGNQMFEYAVGRSLAKKRQTGLKLIFDNPTAAYTSRKYQLWCFKLSHYVTVEIPGRLSRFLSKVSRRIFGPGSNIVRERSFAYDPAILKSRNGSLLDGYFQSEKYFKDIEDIIRSDFTFKESLTAKNKLMADSMRRSNSVSLHIRRGDYVQDKKTNEFHGTAGLDYYAKGIAYIEKRVELPQYFIFSDDINWAKENLKLKGGTFIDWNVGPTDFLDMYLMSLCKHNIIANSSFSWWGAWLNRNPQKIVIAPKRWFLNKSMDTKDLIPHNWVKL